ncbi:MAG: sulfatase [Planctomycetes bacterium]|nr:sulfatase [Planctomycetota bacterium]
MSSETPTLPWTQRIVHGFGLGACLGIAVGGVEGALLLAWTGVGASDPFGGLFEVQAHAGLALGTLGALLWGWVIPRANHAAVFGWLAFLGWFGLGFLWLREGLLIGDSASALMFWGSVSAVTVIGFLLKKTMSRWRIALKPCTTFALGLSVCAHGLAQWQAAGLNATQDFSVEPWQDERPPNFLVLLVDTLRADRLGCYGYERNTSPVMDDLAASGTRFHAAYAQAPWTRPSVASLMTALYPPSHDILDDLDSLPPGLPTIAQVLHARGYSTAAFSANPQVSPVYGFDRGFETFGKMSSSMLRQTAVGRIEHMAKRFTFNVILPMLSGGKRNQAKVSDGALMDDGHGHEDSLRTSQAGSLNKRVYEWVRDYSGENPYFLYVQYIDPHTPYRPPIDLVNEGGQAEVPLPQTLIQKDSAPYPLESFPAADPEVLQGLNRLYDAEIAYTDQEMGKLLDKLKQKGMLENTIIVVTSDHGEELYDHEQWLHGQSLYDELVRVPLIVQGPGVIQQVVQDPVELVDIFPTLSSLAGIDSLDFPIHGQSFAPVLEGGAVDPDQLVYSERQGAWSIHAIRRGTQKLIRIDGPSGELHWLEFDLSKDPQEQINLALEAEPNPELREKLQLLEQAAGALLRSRSGKVEAEGDAAAALAALGYMDEE